MVRRRYVATNHLILLCNTLERSEGQSRTTQHLHEHLSLPSTNDLADRMHDDDCASNSTPPFSRIAVMIRNDWWPSAPNAMKIRRCRCQLCYRRSGKLPSLSATTITTTTKTTTKTASSTSSTSARSTLTSPAIPTASSCPSASAKARGAVGVVFYALAVGAFFYFVFFYRHGPFSLMEEARTLQLRLGGGAGYLERCGVYQKWSVGAGGDGG